MRNKICNYQVQDNYQHKSILSEATITEINLFCILDNNRHRFISKDEIFLKIWGKQSKVNRQIVDVYICRLRKMCSQSDYRLMFRRKYGYRLVTDKVTLHDRLYKILEQL